MRDYVTAAAIGFHEKNIESELIIISSLSHSYVTPIPESLPSDAAAPMLCAGVTVYSALRKSGAQAGDTIAVSFESKMPIMIPHVSEKKAFTSYLQHLNDNFFFSFLLIIDSWSWWWLRSLGLPNRRERHGNPSHRY